MRTSIAQTLVLVLSLAAGRSVCAEPEAESFFAERVAPILTSRCVGCHHGVAARGGLSLTTAEELLAGGEGGPSVMPGDKDASWLLDMIAGPEPEMPKEGPPLADEEVALVARWIAEGAHWPSGLVLRPPADAETWWSLQPLEQPAVPTTGDDWVRTPVDAFVLAKLREVGLAPSPPADRRTLIRRLYFDLHGLPPEPEAVERFVADPDPAAYEKLVDRLLSSPRYGERWARHWLDVVHYGETHGYDKDKRRDNAWPYRDYVIGALNDDKPYERFVREQLAGDVLWPDDRQAVVATGFVAAGPWDFVGHVELREGTVEKQKTRLLDRDDMVANSMSTFVSMTAHCARCHDHPFDPIPQADYYRLQAVFAGVERGDRPVPDPQLDRRREQLEQQAARFAAELRSVEEAIDRAVEPQLAPIDQEIAAVDAQLCAIPDPFATDGDSVESPTNGYHSAIEGEQDTTKWVQVDLGRPLPLEVIRLIPARPTDFADTPGFGFPPRFSVAVSDDPDFAEAHVVCDYRSGDFPNPGAAPVSISLCDVTARYVRVTAHRLWRRNGDYVFALAELQAVSAGENVAARAVVTALDSIDAGRWHTRNLVDGFDSRRRLPELSDPDVTARLRAREGLERQRQSLTIRRAEQAETLIPEAMRRSAAGLSAERASIESQLEDLPDAPQVYAITSHAPRTIHVLARGDVGQPRDEVSPGALSVPARLEHVFTGVGMEEGWRRAELAAWITRADNVLTWRSIVNRVWYYHFGRGLVDTPSDFGRNGAQPTHPELLDWLAVEFRENGQSLKALHRLLVTSEVYRQSSQSTEAAAAIDADNRFCWRMNRRRLDAESIRDSVLYVAGELNAKMGGPSFEAFEFEDDHSPRYDYVAMAGPDVQRRSIYRYIVRSVADPLMQVLDCPDPSLAAPKRDVTITALQALAMLNDPLIVRQSERLAARLEHEGESLPERIEAGFRSAFGRSASREERLALVAYAERHGLAAACRLLLNANEFVFVD